MTYQEIKQKENEILKLMSEDLSNLYSDHLSLMTDICDTPEQVQRWRKDREILRKLEQDFDNLLLVRIGKEPINWEEG